MVVVIGTILDKKKKMKINVSVQSTLPCLCVIKENGVRDACVKSESDTCKTFHFREVFPELFQSPHLSPTSS